MSFELLKKYNLGDLADITSSKRIFLSDYVSTGIPFYRSKEIIQKSLGEEVNDVLYIEKGKYYEIKSKYGAPEDGDILLSAVGERAGIPYVVKNEGDFYFKDGNLIWFRNINSKLNTDYLCYWLKSSEGNHALRSIMIGSAQRALTIIGLKGLEVLLPTIKVQNKIASILSSLDNKIELNRQTNQTLEAIAQALFKEWFVDFKFPGATGEKQDRELGEIPKGWRVVPIGELFHYVIGGDWGKDEQEIDFPNKCAVIRGTDLEDIFNAKTERVPIRFIKESNLSKRKLQEGDIVFEISGGSKDQATGRNAMMTKELLDLFPQDVVPASFCRLIRAKDLKWSFYLGVFLRMFYSEGGTWDFQLQSTGISNFQFAYFKEKKLVVKPTEDMIKLFFEKVFPLYQSIGENTKQIFALSQLRDTLLPKLMKGEINTTN